MIGLQMAEDLSRLSLCHGKDCKQNKNLFLNGWNTFFFLPKNLYDMRISKCRAYTVLYASFVCDKRSKTSQGLTSRIMNYHERQRIHNAWLKSLIFKTWSKSMVPDLISYATINFCHNHAPRPKFASTLGLLYPDLCLGDGDLLG